MNLSDPDSLHKVPLLSEFIEAGVSTLKHDTPAGIRAGAQYIQKLVEESWERAPFRGLAADAAKDVSQGQIALNVQMGSWKQLRVAERGEKGTYVDLPPAIAALIKSDREIWRPITPFGKDWDKNLEFNQSSAKALAKSIGLARSSLRYDLKSDHIQMRLSEAGTKSIEGDGEFVVLPRNKFGVAPGYLTDRSALEAIWRRYTPQQSALTLPAYPDGAYTDRQLRLIERHLGLPESSFQYQGDNLVFVPPSVFTRQSLKSPANVGSPLEQSPALPFRSDISKVQGEYKLNFALDGTSYSLDPRATDFRFVYPEKWWGSGNHNESNFKLRIVADNGADLGRVHDVFIPRLHDDPEFKELLVNWKAANPYFRSRMDALTGQESKALTLYPASMRTIPRLYEKLDRMIQTDAPDLIRSEAPNTLTVDRLLGSTNRLALTKERYDSDANGFVALDWQVVKRFANDKQLPSRPSKAKLDALEEITGIEPGELTLLKDGRLAVRGNKPDDTGRSYLGEGHSLRRGGKNEGYTGRWAMHIVGGRYNVDPISFPIPWMF